MISWPRVTRIFVCLAASGVQHFDGWKGIELFGLIRIKEPYARSILISLVIKAVTMTIKAFVMVMFVDVLSQT